MHLKPARTAARVAAAAGGALVLGLGCAQAAMASPERDVPCSAGALGDALGSGGILLLAGGCTYYVRDTLTVSHNTTIIGNGATLEGGGPDSDYSILYVDCFKTLVLDGVDFTRGSTSDDGGAIDDIGSLYVNGGLFSDNSAGDTGGAIYAASDGTLQIKGATFTSNDAYYGGAVYPDADTNTIIGTDFDRNQADQGGAVYTDWNTTVEDSTFQGNGADQGGGVYVDDHTLTLTNVDSTAGTGDSFTGNVADQGGGIFDNSDVDASAALIVFNEAHQGGGVFNACSDLDVSGSSAIFGNVADNIYFDEDDC